MSHTKSIIFETLARNTRPKSPELALGQLGCSRNPYVAAEAAGHFVLRCVVLCVCVCEEGRGLLLAASSIARQPAASSSMAQQQHNAVRAVRAATLGWAGRSACEHKQPTCMLGVAGVRMGILRACCTVRTIP